MHRPGQKKQGRELKNKARSRFTTKSKFRRGPKPPKHHTPGREHRKYLWLILWRILNMKTMTGGIWIDKDCKNYYTDFKKQGLRLIFHKDIPNDYANQIKKYVKYLRNLYFFPLGVKFIFVIKKNFFQRIENIMYMVFFFMMKMIKNFQKFMYLY